MKIKSLILSSVAAVGFSAGAMAAEPGVVLTSLDVCDALNLTGLTISSADNCLQITGGVDYEFKWGDYEGATAVPTVIVDDYAANHADSVAPDNGNDGVHADHNLDWDSNSSAWLKFVASADSSVGKASGTIKLGYSDSNSSTDEGTLPGSTSAGSTMVTVSEAWVSVGDGTVLMAGRKGSIANMGDDEPLNWIGMFNAGNVNTGVGFSHNVSLPTAGHVIQVVSDLGSGITVKGGLENLQATGTNAGTVVGVLEYDNSGAVVAHATILAGGILDGVIEGWAVHSGISLAMDAYKIRGAFAADSSGYWNVLGTASATFDMFTLALSGEATSGNEIGFGVSASAEVTSGVTINAGFRWFDTNTTVANTESYNAAVQLVAAVTETITITGEVGMNGQNTTPANVAYFSGKLAFEPGGGFTTSIEAQANANGAYSVTSKFGKSII